MPGASKHPALESSSLSSDNSGHGARLPLSGGLSAKAIRDARLVFSGTRPPVPRGLGVRKR